MGLKTPSDCQSYHVVAKNESFALTVLRGSVEALLRRDFQLADKTVMTPENIQAIEDGVLTAIEKDRCLTQVTSNYLEYIRRTAGYASDIAEIALKETIDEVTEKHSATRRRQ